MAPTVRQVTRRSSETAVFEQCVASQAARLSKALVWRASWRAQGTAATTQQILLVIRSRYEEHHKVSITDDAVKASSELAARYITDRFLPDKAIDLMDEAASRVRLRYSTLPAEMKEAQKELDRVGTEKEAAMEAQQYELASTLRQAERVQQDKLQQAKADWLLAQSQKRPEVTDEDIAEVVSMWTGIPVRRLAEEETQKLLKMEDLPCAEPR